MKKWLVFLLLMALLAGLLGCQPYHDTVAAAPSAAPAASAPFVPVAGRVN